VRLDNPLLVRREYASEERLEKRNAILRAVSRGSNPEDAAFAAVASIRPKRILDVGCDLGEVGHRFATDLGAHVCAIDISPRMVELAKSRGLDARVFAGSVLYHVPDLARGIGEVARVLSRDGTLVAAAVCGNDLQEIWELIGVEEPQEPIKFTHENGGELLAPHFGAVEREDVDGEIAVPDTESLRPFVASTIDRAHLAPAVPEIPEPFRATTRHVVFVARRPR
jgi:SAM-dependent methyltransferase